MKLQYDPKEDPSWPSSNICHVFVDKIYKDMVKWLRDTPHSYVAFIYTTDPGKPWVPNEYTKYARVEFRIPIGRKGIFAFKIGNKDHVSTRYAAHLMKIRKVIVPIKFQQGMRQNKSLYTYLWAKRAVKWKVEYAVQLALGTLYGKVLYQLANKESDTAMQTSSGER